MVSSLSTIMAGSYYGISSGFFNTSSSTSSSSSSYLSDYANIRSGSYSKLMKAYYGGSSGAASLVGSSTTNTSTAQEQKSQALTVRDDAQALKESALALEETGNKSIFNKKTVTAKDGTQTQEYDKDSIYKAVSSFVDDYNSLVGNAKESSNNSIVSATSNLAGNTKANKNLLSDIGITIGSDNKLSINQTKFKAADVSTVKSLFNGTGSYAYGAAFSASQMYNQSVSQLAQLAGSSYSNSGTYNYSYSGSLYSSFL